ncbi:MAG: stage III sporulation protein D [Clostridiales bacterium]|nr:stage III sporulation protein D [Clostridiales bacterium]
MREELIKRILEEAYYIEETKATVRKTAKEFHLGKSTVHKDVTERLFLIDKNLHKKVKKVLEQNLKERHIRGGNATKLKYLKEKNKNAF